jgi:hypothetical protein
MRARRFVLAVGLVALSACDRPAEVSIRDARASRGADNRVVVDVDLEAIEQAGGAAGPYCVSVHWFDIGFDPAPQGTQLRYLGETDFVSECANDLGDGDRRTVRLVSSKTDLAAGAPARVQIKHGKLFETKAVAAP